mmetsp:Transcript_40/g.69  ORF Transcript_40/g.69 Transcript_40/m.69 type:complete len:404 (-) Transcript_40:394-1605(-)
MVVSSTVTSQCRTLHWVTKIGNLKKSLRFFEQVFGFRVLRHEEFESGCEATCNGPYGGAWSKTMVGWGPEKLNFVFELTYNYGIDGYSSGNDVQYFLIACPEAVERARFFGYQISYDFGLPIIHGPDGFRYKIVDAVAREERFLAVVLNSTDLKKTEAYWCGVLGATKFKVPPGSPEDALAIGWKEDQCYLVFKTGEVDHAEASGRIANACPQVEPFYEAAKASGQGEIMNTPITLPTPGKADVVVTILADPDKYEICFVGDVGFYDLAQPLYDLIDWNLREKRGADGAPPPKPTQKIQLATDITDEAQLTSFLQLSASSKLALLDFGASWCKNCKKLLPFLHTISTPLATIDVDEAEALASKFQVSAVPHFIGLNPKTGETLFSYVGSSETEINAFIQKFSS